MGERRFGPLAMVAAGLVGAALGFGVAGAVGLVDPLNQGVVGIVAPYATLAATVVLAVITWDYALTTRMLARESAEQRREASKPLLRLELILPGDKTVRFAVRNIGNGPAYEVEIQSDRLPNLAFTQAEAAPVDWAGPDVIEAKGRLQTTMIHEDEVEMVPGPREGVEVGGTVTLTYYDSYGRRWRSRRSLIKKPIMLVQGQPFALSGAWRLSRPITEWDEGDG